MDDSARVCPFCGELPGAGMFCAACGRSFAAVDRLPTAAEWRAAQDPGAADPLATANATVAFVAAMRAAGNPGATEFPTGKRSAFRRPPVLRGWVVRPVDREDFEEPRRYRPGLVLTVDGSYHRLDSELRGWGQRDFPSYAHSVSPDPVDPPLEQTLPAELSAVRAANGV